jgi:xanthine dehydrogenase iron-sulfur cluster and FAD-binding subunit A
VKVDVYRSCTWKEKRDVLNGFWRTNVEVSSRVGEAAVQYGYYAIICLVVVIFELAVILGVALDRNAFVAALTVMAELFTFWSTWWAAKRYRALKYQFAT